MKVTHSHHFARAQQDSAASLADKLYYNRCVVAFGVRYQDYSHAGSALPPEFHILHSYAEGRGD